jgi:CheY-like chemotaxis protein
MKRRALVFDDQPAIRYLLRAFLEGRGYEVLAYEDPSDCPLNGIVSCPCPGGFLCADVIVTDVQMLRVNGMDFINRLILQKNCKLTRIAVLSGSWTEQDLKRAEQMGCKVFEKPFGLVELVEWLREVERDILPDRCLLDLVALPVSEQVELPLKSPGR